MSVEDWVVCEKVQQGTRSRGYDRAIHPREDSIVREFMDLYLSERGP